MPYFDWGQGVTPLSMKKSFCMGFYILLVPLVSIADDSWLSVTGYNTWQTPLATGDVLNWDVAWIPKDATNTPAWSPKGVFAAAAGWRGDQTGWSWPSAPEDRNDHFQVKWEGYWQPGPRTVEIRLRADDEAALFVDGSRILSATHDPIGATATVILDARHHHLLLEYRELAGEAYVILEYREPGTAWKPIEAIASAENSARLGWTATYTSDSGQGIEPTFTRVDRLIDFNWNTSGPFDRPVDRPTLTTLLGQWKGGIIGEVRSNRSGQLVLQIETDRNENQSSKPNLTPTSFDLHPQDPSPAGGIYFDRPGNWQTEESNPTGFAFHATLEPLSPLRFWFEGTGISGGSEVTQRLAELQSANEISRPRMGGDWELYDRQLLLEGRWWMQLLRSGRWGTQSAEASLSDHAMSAAVRRDRAILRDDLPPAILQTIQRVFPDLLPIWAESSSEIETQLDQLISSWGENELGFRNLTESSAPESATGVRSIAEGIGTTLILATMVASHLELTADGHTVWGGTSPVKGEFSLSNWRVAGFTLNFSINAEETRVTRSDQVYLRVSPTSQLGFGEGSDDKTWRVRVNSPPGAFIDLGPWDRIQGTRWNNSPTLFVRKGKSMRLTTIPNPEGELSVQIGEKRTGIPIR